MVPGRWPQPGADARPDRHRDADEEEVLTQESPPQASPPSRGKAVRQQVVTWGGSILLAVVAFFVIQLVRPGPAVQTSADDVAPDFTLTSTDGSTVHLADLRGKPVVVNFWATWCGPCKLELPGFASFARSHPDVTVLGVAVQSGNRATLARAKQDLDIPYAVLVADERVVRDYGVSVFPTTVVLDREGRIVRAQTGILFGWELSLLTR